MKLYTHYTIFCEKTEENLYQLVLPRQDEDTDFEILHKIEDTLNGTGRGVRMNVTTTKEAC